MSIIEGLKVVYNMTNHPGRRVVSAEALCNKCEVPHYEPLDKSKIYRLVSDSYVLSGGNGFDVIKNKQQNRR